MATLSATAPSLGIDLPDLNQFFIDNEKRAFRMALSAVGDKEEALDIVQDSMLKLSRLYAKKTEKEWHILFHKIVQSRIRDWYRRQKVRRAVMGWLPGYSFEEGDEQSDPFEQVVTPGTHDPETMSSLDQKMEELDEAVQNLPTRQREAFFLRCWEGLSTIETANIMNISEGSVKTHYSRALNALRNSLGGNL